MLFPEDIRMLELLELREENARLRMENIRLRELSKESE